MISQKTNSANGSGKPRAVLLVGFMGAGKTSVGRQLSKHLNSDFVDLDDVIVLRANKSIQQIFAEESEAGFRRRETAALRHVLAQAGAAKPMVIALGGGAFVQPDNYQAIRDSGIPSVFLDADLDTLLQRCRSEARVRPLAKDENQFRQLHEARRSSYMKADHCVQTAGKSVPDLVIEIASRLGFE